MRLSSVLQLLLLALGMIIATNCPSSVCAAHAGARLDQRHFFDTPAGSACCYCFNINQVKHPQRMVNAEISPYALLRRQVDKDGNCLFSSISICVYGVPDRHKEVRRRIHEYHLANWRAMVGHYSPREADDIPGHPALPDWPTYCRYIGLPGAWGGEHEIIAAAHIYQRSFIVITPTSTTFITPPVSSSGRTFVPVEQPSDTPALPHGTTHSWLCLVNRHYNAVLSSSNRHIPDSHILVHHRNKAISNLHKICSEQSKGRCKAPQGTRLEASDFRWDVDQVGAGSNNTCHYCTGASREPAIPPPRKPRPRKSNPLAKKGLTPAHHPGSFKVHKALDNTEYWCPCSGDCKGGDIVGKTTYYKHAAARDEDVSNDLHKYTLSASQIAAAIERTNKRNNLPSPDPARPQSLSPTVRDRRDVDCPTVDHGTMEDVAAAAARRDMAELAIKAELLDRSARHATLEAEARNDSTGTAALSYDDNDGGIDDEFEDGMGAGEDQGKGDGSENADEELSQSGDDDDPERERARKARKAALAALLLHQDIVQLQIYRPDLRDDIHPSDNIYEEDWDGEHVDDHAPAAAGANEAPNVDENPDVEEAPDLEEYEQPAPAPGARSTLPRAWYEKWSAEYPDQASVVHPTPPPTFDDLPKTSQLPVLNQQLLFINLIRSATYANAPMTPEDNLELTRRLTTREIPEPLAQLAKPIVIRSLRAWFEFHHDPQRVYKSHCRLVGSQTPPVYMLSLYQVKKLAESITGMKAMEDAMCVNGCMAFTGPDEAAEHCTHPSEEGKLPGICGEERWKTNKRGEVILNKKKKQPRKKVFSYLLGPQIQAQYANPESATAMRYGYRSMQEKSLERRRSREAAEERRVRGEPAVEDTRAFDDWTSGDAVLDKFDRGEFGEDDFFFLYTFDAAKLYRYRESSTFFGAITNLNRPPGERYETDKIMPSILIPGPKKPKHLASFLYPTFHHMSAMMKESITVWDSAQKRWITCRPRLIFLCADGPGLTEINGHVGHQGAKGCRFMCDVVGVLKGTSYHPALFLPADHRERYGRRCDADPARIAAWLPNQGDMMRRVLNLLGAETMADLDRRKTQVGLSFPSVLLGLPEVNTLGFPDVNTFDIMHVVALNMPDHLLGIWRGTHIKEAKETGSFVWEFLKDDEIWKKHGALVAACMPFIPDLFGRPPRDPALCINSGYKASEFLLYIFMLGPGLFYKDMPRPYYVNFCRLIRAMNIFQQRSISFAELQDGLNLILEFAEEFEKLYVRRCQRRMHWVRPWLHTILHLPMHVWQNGPPAYYAQWTLERLIGFVTKDLRNHTLDGSGVNVALILLHLAQFNALSAMEPTLPLPEQDSHLIINLGQGYQLLHKREKRAKLVTPSEAKAIESFLRDSRGDGAAETWKKESSVLRSARLRLPCGLQARSCFAEEEKSGSGHRVTRMVQLIYQGRTRYAEVRYYCQLWKGAAGAGAVAVVVLCTEPEKVALDESLGVARFVRKGGEEDVVVVDVKAISTVVGLFPNIREGYWYVGNKPGRAGPEADDPAAEADPEDGAGGE